MGAKPKYIPSNLISRIKKNASYISLNSVLALPSFSGKVFDFNATLPIMAAQFVILVIFLDKTWFGPVGEVLDSRDELIRNRLMTVKSGNDELETLLSSADKLLKDARADAQAEIADAKSKAATMAEAELANRKSELDSELALAIRDLANDRTSTQADIERQVAGLAEYIVKSVLPAEFSFDLPLRRFIITKI